MWFDPLRSLMLYLGCQLLPYPIIHSNKIIIIGNSIQIKKYESNFIKLASENLLVIRLLVG